MLTQWSEQEIDILKEGFLRGESIKRIACQLNRTPGAVNKALSRFQIRTPRIFKVRAEKVKTASSFKVLREKEIRATINWIDIADVILWLKGIGEKVEQGGGGGYLINRCPKTKLQLLMYANQRRIERGDEIFMVEDVTW